MKVFNANNKWFVATHDSMEEIDYSGILQWQMEGMEILVESGDLVD